MTSAGHRDRQASRPGGGEEGTESCVGGTKCGRVSLPQAAPGVGGEIRAGGGGLGFRAGVASPSLAALPRSPGTAVRDMRIEAWLFFFFFKLFLKIEM